MPSFPYNPNIPLGTDNPSDSQGEILTNFGSISNILAVDHFTFGSMSSTDGQHQQVTLPVPLSGTPAVPLGSASEIYTNALAGIAQLFFINSAGPVQLTSLPLITSGVIFGIRTPWGIQINWGAIAVGAGGSTVPTPVTFPVPFSLSCDAVIATANNTNGNNGNVTVSGKTTTGVNLYSSNNNTVFFLAIGH